MSLTSPMYTEMEIPSTLPVMTLRDTVFFPQSILPLYVFEERYRVMLRDILAADRLFIVVRMDERQSDTAEGEPFHPVATVGMVRASHENADGSSNLVLQGLCRVRIQSVVAEEPYRRVRVVPQSTALPADASTLVSLRDEVCTLLTHERELANDVPEEFLQFLGTIEDLDAYIDLTAFSACPCPDVKQRLLEAIDLEQRYRIYLTYLHRRMARFQFYRQLQGVVPDEDINLN